MSSVSCNGHVCLSTCACPQANIFDTAGGERFRTLTSNYFQHTDAAILMYAVDDQRSLERLYDEAENALQFVEPETFVWAVVGNKCDLRPEIEEATAKALSNQLGANLHFYTSAKTGQSVKASMTALVQTLHRMHTSGRIQSHSYANPHTIKLGNDEGATREARTPNITLADKSNSCCK